MLLLTIKYRIKYYWGAFMEFCGYCKKCGSKMAVTPKGRQICNNIHCTRN